ncbi:MAG: hypothetical protein ACLQLH_03950 [Terracidiphilus sp.]|jgi:hypothetical protein
MRLSSGFIPATFLSGIFLLVLSSSVFSQETPSGPVVAPAAELPEAPQSQLEVAQAQQPPAPQGQPVQQQAQHTIPAAATSDQTPAAQGSSSSQAPAQQSAAEKSKHDLAQEQLKQQEHNRVAGVMAAFNTTQNRNAIPLSPGQKFQLFFKSSFDPWPFGLAAVVAGIGQADDSPVAWGQGLQGYGKRVGGAYTDYFIGNFFGNAVLPSLWHEDPRFYQKGTGSAMSRMLWAAGSTGWCKRDNGKWGPNYANVIGNLIGAAIARVYYPPSQRTVTDTITDGVTVSVEGIVGAEVIEFWPDLARNYKRKQAEKAARIAAQADAAAH